MWTYMFGNKGIEFLHLLLGCLGNGQMSYMQMFSEMQKRSCVSSSSWWQCVWKFTWCLSSSTCQLVAAKLEGWRTFCNSTTEDKRTNVSNQRSTERPLLCMEMRNGTARAMHTVSHGTKVFIWGWCEGGGKHWCDIFITLVNLFLIL